MKNTKAEEELRGIGVNFELIPLTQPVHSVHDVQIACNCEASEVIKTLVLIGGSPVIVIVPGDKKANIAKIENLTGERELRMAKPSEVADITGYNVGTVSPFGIDSEIKQIADESILTLSSLLLGSGKSDVLIRINLVEFSKSFRGTFASISE